MKSKYLSILAAVVILTSLYHVNSASAGLFGPTECTNTPTIMVDSLSDVEDNMDGQCTLRDAIGILNNNSGGTVVFSVSSPYTIVIDDWFAIYADITIDGDNGGNNIILDATNLPYVFEIQDSFLDDKFQNLTLKNATNNAIFTDPSYSDNSLTLDNVTFLNNGGSVSGAAIDIQGDNHTLSISNSMFDSNTAGDIFEYAGAILFLSSGGSVDISGSTFKDNSSEYCSVFFIESESVSITDSTFDSNISNADGNLCFNSIVVISGSTFSNNQAFSGGVFNSSACYDGCISSELSTQVYIYNSTFDHNSSLSYGSVFSDWAANQTAYHIFNTTFTNNMADTSEADADLNPAGGLFFFTYDGSVTYQINNSIFYGNSDVSYNSESIIRPLCPLDDNGIEVSDPSIISGDYNLIEDTGIDDCPSSFTGAANTNYITTAYDDIFGALADNEGPTNTIALLSGNPAIDAVPVSECKYDDGTSTGVTLAKDQRGYDRPFGTACDIGAYESQEASNTFTISDDDVQLDYDTASPDTFNFTFSNDVYDPEGDTDLKDVTNPVNWLFVDLGGNTVLDTQSCFDGVISDDVQVNVASVTYVAASKTATIHLDTPLGEGNYAIFACGTTSIYADPGIGNSPMMKLNDGEDSIFEFSVSFTSTQPGSGEKSKSDVSLPNTGFAKGQITILPEQNKSQVYLATTINLTIPSLNVSAAIVGVPNTSGNWDVTWLGNQLGWLEGTAYPTWDGNTVLTGHVWDAFNRPGVFANLKSLKEGDRIELNAYGQTYIYEVRESVLRWSTEDFSNVIKHKTTDWITLITCEGYMPIGQSYLFRRVVSAELVAVQ